MRAAAIGIAAALLVTVALAVDLQRTPQDLQFQQQDADFHLEGSYTRTAAEAPPLCLPDCAGPQHELRLHVTGLPDLPLEARLDGRALPLDAIVASGAGPGPARLQLAWIDGPVWYDIPLQPGAIDRDVRIPLLDGAPSGSTEQLGSIAVALRIDMAFDGDVPPGVTLHGWLGAQSLGPFTDRVSDRLDGVRSGDVVLSLEREGATPERPGFIAWRA